MMAISAREVASEIREMIDAADGDPQEEYKLSRKELDELITKIYQYCEYVLDSVLDLEREEQ